MAKALELRPHDDSSETFDAYRRAKMAEARRGLEATLSKTDPRLLALNALLGAVQKSSHPRVHFRSKPMPPQGATGAQASAFSERELTEAMRRFPLKLYGGFSQAMTMRAREVLAVTPGSAERGVAVEVALTPRLLEKSVQVGKTRWPLLGLTATAVLDGHTLATVPVEIDDGDLALLTSEPSASAVLDAQMERLLFKTGAALARAFGLAVEP
jgi:hypothetical protein